MTRDALAKAPAEFIGTVVKMIHAEKALERSAEGHPNSALRFYILRDLEGCWDDEALKTAIFQELMSLSTQSDVFSAVFDHGI